MEKNGQLRQEYSKNIKKMYFIKFFFWMYFISAVLIPFYTDWGGITFTEILLLNAWFRIWIFILEVPTGTVADFLGRKVSITLAGFVGIIGAIVYTSSPDIYVFMIGEVFWAISYTLMSGADEAFIYDSLIELGEEKRSKKVYSRMESVKLGGIVVGAFLGAFIAKFLGLRMSLLLQAIPFSIAFLSALTLKEPVSHFDEKKEKYSRILITGMKYFFGNKILVALALDMIIVNGLTWCIIFFYQPLLRIAGIDIIYFGVIHSAMALVEIFVIENFGKFERVLGSKKKLILFTAVTTGMAFILLGLTSWPPVVIFLVILSAGTGLSRIPLFINYMNKYIPSEKRATVLSTTSMLSTLVIVIINPIAGLLADWSIPNTMIIMGVGIILFSVISRIEEEHLID